jgi:hypothetical protein
MNPTCDHCGKEIRPTQQMIVLAPQNYEDPARRYHDKCRRKRLKKQCDALVKMMRKE